MSKVVLIAVGNSHVRYLLSKIVSELNYIAGEASNGARAFAMLETVSFNLVVVGSLPDISLSDFLTQLHQGGVNAPVVVIPGPHDPRFLHPLISEIIPTPISVNKVMEAIQKYG